MDWFIIILGILLCVVAIGGSLLPLLPGPPFAFLGLLLQQARDPNPFSWKFIFIWGFIVLLALILDYFIPIWGTKKFGGTKYGIWGCTLGFLAAFWLGPWGVILGPMAGAFLGELLAKQNSTHALKAAFGAFLGFMVGSFLKLLVCFFMLYYVIDSI